MDSKNCHNCHYTTNIIKNGITSSGRQRYKCKICGSSWTNKPKPKINLSKQLWNDYVFHNMNIAELAEKYSLSEKTIRNKMQPYKPPEIIPIPASVIVIDVTYFGRKWGLLTVLDAESGVCLYCEKTNGYETVSDYEQAIKFLHRYNIYPVAAVVDGKVGVVQMLENYGIIVQFCQFHQSKIITQCLTRKPVLTANIELRAIALSLGNTNEEMFKLRLEKWKLRHETWLKEKTFLEDGKHWYYTHKNTRRAFNSLSKNLPYLFTFNNYPQLKIPNTNNKIEGIHSELKRRLANHRGLGKQHTVTFARIFLSGRTGV